MAAVRSEDVEYLVHESGPLLARIYHPVSTPAMAVIDIHGGTWTRESRLTNAVIDTALAEAGFLVMAPDFRMPPTARYPEPVADIHAAIRWLSAMSGLPVCGVGTSSGGHQLMLAAMRPEDARYSALPQPGSALLASVALGWAVFDPLARYRYAHAQAMDKHITAHDAYWPDEAAMAEGNPTQILQRGEAVRLPPALILQGTADVILTPTMADDFATAYTARGGQVTLRHFADQPHTFITKHPERAEARQAIEAIIEHFRTA